MNELNIISYNIWFDSILEVERVNSLINTICSNNADVICLQEVRPDIYKILITQLKNYKYHYPKRIEHNYGCAILSRYPITKTLTHEFNNSLMGRSLIIVKIDYPTHIETDNGIDIKNTEVVVATTHFESQFNKSIENTTKLEQYQETEKLFEKLYDMYKNVVLCADLNILNNEESKFINTDNNIWKDGWKEKGSESNKYTFDGKTNIYLQMKNCKYRSRLDRIIYRTNNCEINSFDMLISSEGNTEPSDHYGVMCKFSVN